MPREQLSKDEIEALLTDARQYVDDDYTVEMWDDASGNPWLRYRAPHEHISLEMGECRTDLRLISVEHLKALTARSVSAPGTKQSLPDTSDRSIDVPLDEYERRRVYENDHANWIEVPATLLPLIGYLPKGSLVLIHVSPALFQEYQRSTEGLLGRYRKALCTEFGDCVADMPEYKMSCSDALHESRMHLRGLKTACVAESEIVFVFQNDRNWLADTSHEADYTFRITEGWADSLIIELGKCRRAELIPRTHALIFHG